MPGQARTKRKSIISNARYTCNHLGVNGICGCEVYRQICPIIGLELLQLVIASDRDIAECQKRHGRDAQNGIENKGRVNDDLGALV